MAEEVRPTRMELLRTRRRIVLAKKGLNLLKLKRSALIAEFFNLSKQALELRGDLQAKIARGYGSRTSRCSSPSSPACASTRRT
jgi:V/A-type H+-transporting ATPase subunit D